MAVKTISRPKAAKALPKSKPVTMKTINEAFVRMTAYPNYVFTVFSNRHIHAVNLI